MKTSVRIILTVAGGAFVLSSLVGLVAGVRLGVILIRSLVGAGAFGALSFVALHLIQIYLPELAEAVGHNPSSYSGGAVDISVGEDDSEEQRASGGEEGPPGEAQPTPAGQASGGSAAETGIGLDESLIEEIEERPAPERDSAESQEAFETSEDIEDVVTDVDRLPDMGELRGGLSLQSESSVNGGAEFGDEGQGATQAGPQTERSDPAEMAKAIRSVLKREE